MTETKSKAERLKAAKAELDEVYWAWLRAYEKADRAWDEAIRKVRAIEGEP